MLLAPRSGQILPGNWVESREDPTGKLPMWSGLAMSEKNLGATFTEGTVLCLIGDAHSLESAMLVDQSEVEFVSVGQTVELKLDAFPYQTIVGTVDELAQARVESSSQRLSVKSGGQVPTRTDESGRELPISTSYEASMKIDDENGYLIPGMRGTARIQVGSRTVGGWLVRLFHQTFNFKL